MRAHILPVAVLSMLSILPLTAGSITIEVIPALAPNTFGSPSYNGWVANAVNALENNLLSYGTGPAGYQAASGTYHTEQVIVTGFYSWMGVADPATTFGNAYALELGNRMSFGLRVLGNGDQFSISQLSFSAASSDLANALGFGYAGGYNYSSGNVGLSYGGDRKKGTLDDQWISTGAADQLIDELYGRGSGNSLEALCTGCTVVQQQAAIDEAAAYGPGRFTGTYTIGGVSGSGTFDIVTPEPGTILLLGAGLAFLAAAGRRKRRAA